jgi:hypothetical protein
MPCRALALRSFAGFTPAERLSIVYGKLVSSKQQASDRANHRPGTVPSVDGFITFASSGRAPFDGLDTTVPVDRPNARLSTTGSRQWGDSATGRASESGPLSVQDIVRDHLQEPRRPAARD